MPLKLKQKKRPFKVYPNAIPPAIKSYVTKAIDNNNEDKMINASLVTGFGAVSTTWTEVVTNAIAAGTESNQRTGRRIKLKSLHIDGVIAAGCSENVLDDPYNVVRMVIGLYTQGTTNTPLTTGLASLTAPINNIATCNGRLIKKYYDKFIPLEVTSTEKGDGDGYTPGLRRIKYYKHWKKGIIVEYNGTESSAYNKLLVISMLSDSAAASSPGFVAGYWVLRYEDA